jgi:hypothetical protein
MDLRHLKARCIAKALQTDRAKFMGDLFVITAVTYLAQLF